MESIKRGIITSSVLSFLSKFLGYLRYLTIAFFIGLNDKTDAFFISYSIIGIVLVFVDVFDSLGVPRLVKARQKGKKYFIQEASSLFSFALLSAIVFSFFLLFLAVILYYSELSFTQINLKIVSANLVILIPFAVSGFIIHFYSAVLRSLRRFTDYFLGELIFSFFSLIFTYIGLVKTNNVYALAASLTISQIIFLIYITIALKRAFYITLFPLRNFGKYFYPFLYLSLLYGIYYLLAITDKFFATFLEVKSVSAVTYGLLIVTTIKAIFRVEQIFITKFSEIDAEANYVMKRTALIFILSFFIFLLVFYSSDSIVKILFGYGNFSNIDVILVSTALKYYSFSIPFLFLWAIIFRIYQILEQLPSIFIISLFSLFANIFLNYLLVFIFNMGIVGICLATSITYIILTLSSLLYLIRIYFIRAASRRNRINMEK